MTIYGSGELQFCMTCHPSYVFLKATIQSYFQKCLEPATGSVLYKKLFLKILQNCQSPFFNKDDLVKKGTLAQVFSCEFCEIFTELQTTASKYLLQNFRKLENNGDPYLISHICFGKVLQSFNIFKISIIKSNVF